MKNYRLELALGLVMGAIAIVFALGTILAQEITK